RLWISSGESLRVELAQRFLELMPQSQLLNLYGSSEVAADVTAFAVGSGSAQPACMPIGTPIANTQIYLLDRHKQPKPVGVPGELHVGGAGLARGYLRRPDLTAERFIPDPIGNSCGGRLYTTGDGARYQAEGTIDFLGRIDH